MSIVDIYQKEFCGQCAEGCAFSLVEYCAGYYTGVGAEGRAVVVVESSTPKAHPLAQETRSLRMECNVKVKCLVFGKSLEKTVHALTCIPRDVETINLFLELADLLLHKADRTAEGVMTVYFALADFFANSELITDNELLGLYGELFTICDYASNYDFAACWQSTNRMKFDFSISEKLKVEVKTTLKPQRIHHFKHDQIVADGCDVYVISYQMRPDDQGLSLYELIEMSKELCIDDPKKVMKLQQVIKNAGSERLSNFKFNQDFARQERYVYYSIQLPHFRGASPDGVSSAEYDVDFTGVPTVSEETFLQVVSLNANGL